jgi:hypothetical protein
MAHIQAFIEGRVAGKLAYDTINHVTEVQSNPNGLVLSKDEIKGEIIFKNVNFTYPTR